jgi:hypothetical protein
VRVSCADAVAEPVIMRTKANASTGRSRFMQENK